MSAFRQALHGVATKHHHAFEALVDHRKYNVTLSRYLGLIETGQVDRAMAEREHLIGQMQHLEAQLRAAIRKRERQ